MGLILGYFSLRVNCPQDLHLTSAPNCSIVKFLPPPGVQPLCGVVGLGSWFLKICSGKGGLLFLLMAVIFITN